MFRISRLAFFVCAASAFAATSPARLPLRFEENRGQFPTDVRFTARSAGPPLQLTTRGAAFAVGAARVELALVHASANPKIEALDRMAATTNYIIGARANWHTGIANFARVRYHEVYPGIDVVYYGKDNQLEYDFVLAPGADPDAIRMKFSGDVRVSLTADGDIALEHEGATALQKAPVIFQDGRKVQGRYTLLGRNEVGFHVPHYDRTRPLTIDPILLYCTYFGTSGTDQVNAMKMGPKGLLYIVGQTTTGEFSTIDGAYSDHQLGLTDIFLAIVDTNDPNYSLKYFSYFGGSALDIPLAIDVDSKGVAWMTGTTTSVDLPLAGSSIQTAGSATSVMAFVSAIDPSRYGGDSLVYSTYLGGTTGNQAGNGIAVGKDGTVYVIGTTKSTDFPITTSGYAQVLYGSQDAFLCRIDPNSSSLLYSTYLGGELTDEGRAIAVGSDNKVYFVASTVSTQFPMEGPGYRQNINSPDGSATQDIVIGKMDMTQFGTPSLVYSSYFGGSALDDVRGLTLDSANRMVLTGYTLSTDFPVTSDAAQSSQGGNGDAFVSIVNPSDPPRFLAYSTYFGGSQGEVGYGVQVDSAGSLYLSGYTLSPDLFTVAAPQPDWGQGINLFVAKIKPGVAGKQAIQFSTYFGQSNSYVAKSVAVGADGTIFTAGYGGIGLPSSGNARGYAGGTTDGFLVVVK